MAGTRKSATTRERKRREGEEVEERKREDDRKRQRTLFHRKDNIIRKNDLVVDTRLGKVALVSEEAPEDVKVKVETNDEEEEIQQVDHSEFSDKEQEVVFDTSELDIPTEAGDLADNRPETDDSPRTQINVSREVEVTASENVTATNYQFEAQLVSLRLEMEAMKQLVKEQDCKIAYLSTELESGKAKVKKEQEKIRRLTTELELVKKKTSQRLEEHGKMRKAEFDLLKAENVWLVESVNQLTREVEATKRKNEEENNLSGEGYTESDPESQNHLILESDRKPQENPAEGHSEDMAASSSVTNGDGDTTAANTPMMEDPDMEAVLSRILKFIGKDVQALKTFRSVCRAWNQVSLPTWRRLAVIILDREHVASGTQFLMEYQNDQSPFGLADKPYSRYKLKNLFINEGEIWVRFWDLIGPSMEYVHFDNCVIANTISDSFPKLLIEKMPNLKELALTSVTYDNFKEEDIEMPLLDRNHSKLKLLRVSGEIEIYLERLLVCLTSLESIQVTNDEKRKVIHDDTLEKISQVKISNPTSLPNLRHLDLMNAFTQLKTLKSCHAIYFRHNLEPFVSAIGSLQLKSFAMAFVHREFNIDPFLKSQANTLEVLKLFRLPIAGNEFFTFLCQAEMTAMKEIYLWGRVTVSLGFLKYTPNLKILYVNLTCSEKRDRMKQAINMYDDVRVEYEKFKEDMVQTVDFVMKGVLLESLKTLYIDYHFPERSLRTLAEWVPNLKILKTIVSWRNVSAVVEGWSELEELTCLFESRLRDGNICEKESTLRRNNEFVISDLKKLEHFQLDCLCDASILTDASVFIGFLKMPSLKSVQICVSKQFTGDAEEALKNRVKNCRIIRNHTRGDHPSYDCCQRREFDLEVATTGLRVNSNGYVDL